MTSNIITPKGRNVKMITDALRKLQVGDVIVMARKHRSWSGIYSAASKLGIEITASAQLGEPAIILRYA